MQHSVDIKNVLELLALTFMDICDMLLSEKSTYACDELIKITFCFNSSVYIIISNMKMFYEHRER